jgi:hypothetical protein
MRRGRHAEWSGSVVFISVATGVFCRSNVEAEGSAIECVRLVSDSPWWSSTVDHLSLQRVAALVVA